MAHARESRRLVVADTNVLINFLLVRRLDLLVDHDDYRFVVTEHVRAELTRPVQRAAVEAAVASGGFGQASLVRPEELATYATLRRVLGGGEAAAIAVAARRGWLVATDERGRARREIESRLGPGRQLTTPGVILRCIQNDRLTVEQADALKRRLATRRFVMRFRSFGDLVSRRARP